MRGETLHLRVTLILHHLGGKELWAATERVRGAIELLGKLEVHKRQVPIVVHKDGVGAPRAVHHVLVVQVLQRQNY